MPRRKNSLRLAGYDYSQHGGYAVTIVSKNRETLFGSIVNGEIILNEIGKVTKSAWEYINPVQRAGLKYPSKDAIDRMNVLSVNQPVPTRQLLSQIVGGFKTVSARRINVLRNTPKATVRQRGFHDPIIRNNDELNQFRAYIQTNPQRLSMFLDHI